MTLIPSSAKAVVIADAVRKINMKINAYFNFFIVTPQKILLFRLKNSRYVYIITLKRRFRKRMSDFGGKRHFRTVRKKVLKFKVILGLRIDKKRFL